MTKKNPNLLVFFSDKRNSTGNLYFNDPRGSNGSVDSMSQSFQGSNGRIGSNGIGSSFGHSQPIRVNSTTSINSDDDGPHNAVSRELRTAAGMVAFIHARTCRS